MSAHFDKLCKYQVGDRFVDPDPRDFLKVLKIGGRGDIRGPRYYVTDDDKRSRWVSEAWLDDQARIE